MEKDELKKRELQFIGGGDESGPGDCVCGCNGPSSIEDIFLANKAEGFTDTEGDPWCCSYSTQEAHSNWNV